MTHVRIKVARKFAPHSMLLKAAARALDSAKAKSEVFWWDWLAAILYCSLSIEAIGNTYGETLISRWEDFGSASPLAKIRLVAERCGVQPKFSEHPWAIVPELIRFRNRIAHAKLEEILVDVVYPADDCEKHLYKKPESKLEKFVTERFAQQSYDCIFKILGLLASGLPEDTVAQLENDGWEGGADFSIQQ